MSIRHERVKFSNLETTERPDGRCQTTVGLEWPRGVRVAATAVGQNTPHGRLRSAAEAAADALSRATHGSVQLEVLAIKALEEFDTIVVIVSLRGELDGVVERLVGSCLIKDDAPRGAVLAVLSATNRLIGKILHIQSA